MTNIGLSFGAGRQDRFRRRHAESRPYPADCTAGPFCFVGCAMGRVSKEKDPDRDPKIAAPPALPAGNVAVT
jgi:hypothetical protein